MKEKYCYCAADIVKEHQKYDEKEKDASGNWVQSKKFKVAKITGPLTQKKFTVNLGYEMFMGPEIFFQPEFVNKDYREPIDQIVDHAILTAPIDTRASLYANIVLSGGSTLFNNFDKRLE